MADPLADSSNLKCDLADDCAFYQQMINQQGELPLRGLVRKHCDGDPESCARKQLADEHGRDTVPDNMMPNGLPIPGTSDDDWPPEATDS